MPAKLIRASCPLPGIGLRPPWHKYAMKLEVTLIGPPRTLPIGENIHGTYRRTCRTGRCCRTSRDRYSIQRYIWCRRTRMTAAIHCPPTRNANNLIGIDEIRVCYVIVGCQTSPICTKAVRYPTECISTHNYICAVTARADGLRLSMRAPHIQAQ
jgi:hypothetical protein